MTPNRTQFEGYARQMGFTDFEQNEFNDYKNPFIQGPWNFWQASRDALSVDTEVYVDCMDCKGSERPGWKRGVKCLTCNGDGGFTLPTPHALLPALPPQKITREDFHKCIDALTDDDLEVVINKYLCGAEDKEAVLGLRRTAT